MPDVDLSRYPMDTLARWLCEFHVFHWPDDFPAPAPDGWELLTNLARFSHPALMSTFWALHAVVPDSAFAAYWRGPFGGGKALRVRRAPEPTESWRDRPPLL